MINMTAYPRLHQDRANTLVANSFCLKGAVLYYGEKKHKDICWDCDFETMNGKDIDDDIGDVLAEREEEEYMYDPINNAPPSWMNRG
jgi:hypothetical protein